MNSINTYTGATTINGGTLALSGAGSIADSSDVILNDGATFNISDTTSDVSINNLDGSGRVLLGNASLTIVDGGSFSGDAGGNGSYGSPSGGNGGNGGIAMSGTGFNFTNTASISGGAGGNGGTGYNGDSEGSYSTTGGNGGNGGIAVSGTGFNFTNTASISGGAGGNGGTDYNEDSEGSYSATGGNGGSGGVAVNGSGFTLTNNDGSISGGYGGNGGRGNNEDSEGSYSATGGNGGNGGVAINGTTGFTLTNNDGSISGGNGGNGGGGYESDNSANGGNGGNGGMAVNGSGFTLTNTGTISGGNGGNAGNGYESENSATGGNGGNGGTAVNGSGFNLTNTGSIIGGNGGSGGDGSSADGTYGFGGVGVVSTGESTITTSGSIKGGLAGDNSTQADAIDFSGGGNSLILEAGFSFIGNVVSTSGTTNGDTLALGGSSDATFDISIVGGSEEFQGFSQLEVKETATWTVTGTNNSGLGWDVDGGTLSVASASTLGSTALTFNGGILQTTVGITDTANVTLGSNGGTIDTDGQIDTFSGLISGSGLLVVTDSSGNNTGDLTLSNTDNGSYAWDTTIDSGMLSISSSSDIGTGAITFGGGELAWTASTGTISNNISMSGNGIIDAGGSADALTLSGTLNNAVTGNALVLQNGNFTLANNSNSGDFTTGTLQIGGGTGLSATVQFSNANQLPATSAFIALNGGTLQPTASVTVVNPIELGDNGGTLDAGLGNSNVGNPDIFSGQFTQTGTSESLNIIASGTNGGSIVLNNNANNFSGGTTIGSSGSYMDVLAGADNVFGSGTLTLGSNGVLNTTNLLPLGYDGFGTGTSGATPIHITVGGFDSSSNDHYVRLAVTGQATNITFSSGLYHINNTLTSDSTNDAIVVTGSGTATLGTNGAELLMVFPSFFALHATFNLPYDFSQYVVVDTGAGGSITGDFNGVSAFKNASILTGAIGTDSNGNQDYVVTVQTDFAAIANTPNEKAVANYIDQYATPAWANNPATSKSLVSALIAMSQGSYSQITDVLNESSPQTYADLQNQSIQNNTFLTQQVFSQVQNAFQGGGFNSSGLALLKTSDQDPFTVSMDAAMASAQQQAKNSVAYLDNTPVNMPGVGPEVPTQESPCSNLSGFVIGTITVDHLQQSGGNPDQHFTTGGVMAGLDYRLNRNLVVGALFNWGYTGGTLDNFGSRQQSSSYTPGVFVGYKQGDFYADGLASYTYNTYKINRNIDMPGSSSVATGEPDSNEYDANALVGYNLPLCHGLQAGPAAGVGFTQMNISGVNETGSPYDLTVAKQHADSLRSLLGMQAQYAFAPANDPLPVNINFNAFWQHEFLNSARDINASFTNLGGGSFIFNTAGPSRDSALLGLGVSGYITKNVSLFVNYETQVGDHNQFAQTVMGGVAASF